MQRLLLLVFLTTIAIDWPQLPLNMRADFAWGRDDSTFALSIGEAF